MTPYDALEKITMSHAATMLDSLQEYGLTADTLDGIATAICAQMLMLSFTYPEYAQALLNALPRIVRQPLADQIATLVREIPIAVETEAAP